MIAGATGSSLQRTAPAFSSSKPSYNYSVVAIDSADVRSESTSVTIIVNQNVSSTVWNAILPPPGSKIGNITKQDLVDNMNEDANGNGGNASFALVNNQIIATCKNNYQATPAYPGQQKVLVAAQSYGYYGTNFNQWFGRSFVNKEVPEFTDGYHRQRSGPHALIGYIEYWAWGFGCYPKA
ncbi:hypothetical protein [Francisella tularensis]|uniref:hypothetical protein n=1 Tax=Francisella tularensis TaxID=263 RepID=UPI00018554A8|nr:hypothetical protein [Francisella tularensis]EDZ91195.1 conserved hypothetical protein [Francisella tularensis subsp. novicida FTG]